MTKTSFYQFLYILVIFLACFFLNIWAEKGIFQPSLPEIIEEFTENINSSNFNFISAEQSQSLNPYSVFSKTFITAIFILLLTHCFAKLANRKIDRNLTRQIAVLSLIALCGLCGIQQISRHRGLKEIITATSGLSEEERIHNFFGEIYQFSQQCKQRVKTPIQADIVSGIPLDKDPYMFIHRSLAYFLYPEISTRVDNQTPKQGLLIIFENHPEEKIPEQYHIVARSQSNLFVFAMKQ